MTNEFCSPPVTVRFAPEFKRNIRALAKKYRHIRSDVQPVIDQLLEGKFVGNQIPRVGHTLFKVRVQNSDIRKGKSAGYRIIYQLKDSTEVIIITIYSKLDQGNISASQIRRFIRHLQAETL